MRSSPKQANQITILIYVLYVCPVGSFEDHCEKKTSAYKLLKIEDFYFKHLMELVFSQRWLCLEESFTL